MKSKFSFLILCAAAAIFLSAGLQAQEQVEVSVKVKKDGNLVKDTTYIFDNASEAEHAIQMMDLMTGDDEHMAHAGSGAAKTMVFVSEDGERTEIREISGDSAAWVTKKEVDGDHVKVMKYKINEGDHAGAEKVIVMKSKDGNTFDILVDGDEHRMDADEHVIVREGDDQVRVRVMKIEEETDGENIKVVVITEAGDGEHDHDSDIDHDKEIEVKVVKKEEKK